MLEKLKEFDWASVEHAYGPATDVPELLETLAKGDPETEADAQWALFGNLWHQGTVYEATRFAVPFLLEMLSPDSKADRSWIMFYLSNLATGSSYMEVHKDFMENTDTEEFSTELEKELADVKSAREAVQSGIPLYLQLLQEDDRDIRASASYLISVFAEDREQYWDAIFKVANEDPDEIARTSAQLACFVSATPEMLPDLADFALSRFPLETELGQWTVGRIVLTSAPDRVTKEVIDAVVAGLTSESLDAALDPSPWRAQGAPATTCAALTHLSREHVPHVLGPMIDAMNSADPSAALDMAGTILDMVFEFEPCPHTSFDALDDAQKTGVTAVAQSDVAWTINVNMSDMLGWFQLPNRRPELQTFCGVEVTEAPTSFQAMGPGGTIATATFTPADDDE